MGVPKYRASDLRVYRIHRDTLARVNTPSTWVGHNGSMASIRQRTSRAGETTWAVLYRHGERQTSRTFGDERQARDYAQLVDILGPDRAWAAIFEQLPDDRLTVAELAEHFLRWKAEKVTARTMVDYRRDVANYVLPRFGHRAAESVTETDVQEWVDAMSRGMDGREPLSAKSVADRHMLLHSMYAYGCRKTRRLVTHNPCTETEMPRATSKPLPKGSTIPEWRLLIETARATNPDAGDLIEFLGSTGWRWSEAAALGVMDVEDDGESVHVTVTRVFRTDGHARQVLVEGAAKSGAAFRRVRLPSQTAAMVRRRLVGRGPGDLVFTNSRGRQWSQQTFLRDTWPGIVRRAGLTERGLTPHHLRHMAVAALAAAGVSLPEIQRTIGHESIQTTIGVYGRMIGGMDVATMSALDAILSGKGPAGSRVGGIVVGSVVDSLELDA